MYINYQQKYLQEYFWIFSIVEAENTVLCLEICVLSTPPVGEQRTEVTKKGWCLLFRAWYWIFKYLFLISERIEVEIDFHFYCKIKLTIMKFIYFQFSYIIKENSPTELSDWSTWKLSRIFWMSTFNAFSYLLSIFQHF